MVFITGVEGEVGGMAVLPPVVGLVEEVEEVQIIRMG